jgi:hypothetical protein
MNPHPSPEGNSPTRLSTSGHARYKGSSFTPRNTVWPLENGKKLYPETSVTSTNLCHMTSHNNEGLNQGCKNLGRQVTVASKFLKFEFNICECSEWKLCHSNILFSIILKRILCIWKISNSLVQTLLSHVLHENFIENVRYRLKWSQVSIQVQSLTTLDTRAVSSNSTLRMWAHFYCCPVWVQTVPLFLPWSPNKNLQTDVKPHTTEDLGPLFHLGRTEKNEPRTYPTHVASSLSK